MRSSRIVLLALTAQVHGEELSANRTSSASDSKSKVVDKLVDKMVDILLSKVSGAQSVFRFSSYPVPLPRSSLLRTRSFQTGDVKSPKDEETLKRMESWGLGDMPVPTKEMMEEAMKPDALETRPESVAFRGLTSDPTAKRAETARQVAERQLVTDELERLQREQKEKYEKEQAEEKRRIEEEAEVDERAVSLLTRAERVELEIQMENEMADVKLPFIGRPPREIRDQISALNADKDKEEEQKPSGELPPVFERFLRQRNLRAVVAAVFSAIIYLKFKQ